MIERFIPEFIKNDPHLLSFAQACARPFVNAYNLIGSLPTYIDPMAAPASWLPFLLQLVGMPRFGQATVAQQRALIQIAFRIWAKKGTGEAIVLFINARFDIGVIVRRDIYTAAIAGIAIADDICGTQGGEIWHFHLDLPRRLDQFTPPITEAMFRTELELVVPCFETYTINEP